MKLKIDSYEFMNYEIMNRNSWDQEAKLHKLLKLTYVKPVQSSGCVMGTNYKLSTFVKNTRYDAKRSTLCF